MTNQTSSDPDHSSESKRGRVWFVRIVAVSAVLLLTALLVVPLVLAKTGLRDRLINSIIGTAHLSASTETASFGWFSPLSVEGVEIYGEQRRFKLEVSRIAAEQSWPRLLAASPHLGTITIDHPHAEFHLPLAETELHATMLPPTFEAVVNDASLTVHCAGVEESVIELDGIDVSVRIEEAGAGRVLTVDPVQVFSKQDLTPKLCCKLVQLVNPSVQNAAQVEGQVSLTLAKLRIPIGIPKDQLVEQIEVEGELGLHQVSIETESAMPVAVAKMLADMYGQKVPETIRVVKDENIKFWARDGRLHHEGLRLGFPDIEPELQISSRGSVGLDESLDLYLDVPRLDNAKRKTNEPVHCHITGTMSEPKMSAKNASLVLHMPGSSEKLLEVDGVDFNVRIDETPSGRVLVVDPVKVLDREKLSGQQVGTILHLIKPEIRYATELSGEMSLAFNEMRIPMNVSRERWIESLDVSGRLAVHQITTLAKDPMRQALVKLLADLYEKEVTSVVRIAHDTDVDFHLQDGRIHYEGLRLGFPDISPALEVYSRGSVGLDETLDVHLEVPRLDDAKQKEAGPVQCHLTGTIDEPKLSAKNASLVLRLPNDPEAILDVDGMDLAMRVEGPPTGRELIVDPVEVFKHEKISRHATSSIIHLIAPDIRDAPEVAGEFSLAFDRMRIPLTAPEEEWLAGLEVNGILALHQVTSTVEKPIRQALVKLLADLHGKDVTEVVRVAHDAEIQFQLQDGRLHYEGLRFGFPDIDPALQVNSRGSVGFDETLDLHVELPRLDKEKMKDLGPVDCHVTGTLSAPQVTAKNASLVLRLANESEALIDVAGVDLVVRVEETPTRRMLIVDSVSIFEKQKFTPDLSDQLIRLVAPTLGDVAHVQGEVSLSLEECRFPLGASIAQFAKELEFTGTLHLHEIATTIETPLLGAVVKVLADLYGKQAPDEIRVVRNAVVRFQARNGRLFHEGLKIGFPDISADLVASASGSVGFDHSLDLVLEVPKVLAEAGLTRDDVTQGHIRFRITGTVEEPIVEEVK